MNQLQTREPINTLPENSKTFVALRVGNKSVSDISPNVVKSSCAEVLVKSSFEMGSPMADDPQILQFQTEALFTELKGKLATLTIPEVFESFKMGIRGSFGQFFGMCPKTYHQFLIGFFELPDRGKSWILYLESCEKLQTVDKPVQLTPEYLKRISIKAFEDYKSEGKLPMVSHAIYDTIKELKGVPTLMDPKKWEGIKALAKESYKAQQLKGVPKNRIQSVEKLLNYDADNRSFEFHVKKIGLQLFFDELIANNQNLEI